jgi:molybdopterin-guanine dinucleotide biosynthesis protein B
MNVVCFAGYSGSGKTTLVEGVIGALKLRGLRVSVVKHAHHKFDIDHPGKDTWRHRQAGAFEVVAASSQRMALVREFEQETQVTVHPLIAQLDSRVDWVLVEGFKQSDLLKVEVWRADAGQPARYADDDCVVAIATDDASRLPAPTQCPLLDINDHDAVAQWLIDQGDRFTYLAEHYA